MSLSIQSGYLNFIKSKLNSRVGFLEKYCVIYPEFFTDEEVKYLKAIKFAEQDIDGLKALQERITGIENQIESILQSFSEGKSEMVPHSDY